MSSTAILNGLTRPQLTSAVQQIIDSPKFWEKNSHVEVMNRLRIRSEILEGRWPDYPVFSPYAATHDGYSQGMHTPFLKVMSWSLISYPLSEVSRH